MAVETTDAEAKRHPDWLLWEKGIYEELETLCAAGTWELIDKLDNANMVGSKWVFRAKKDAARNMVRHKACLVTQGFSQVPGIDYFDTYTPVTKMASIHSILSMAAILDMELHQIDIKGAYLNGELTENEIIYIKQPPGYPSPDSSGKVCRLHKTLYALKQVVTNGTRNSCRSSLTVSPSHNVRSIRPFLCKKTTTD
jgi:Reverse transcriptase (RNA-dependent DNA polymerase)